MYSPTIIHAVLKGPPKTTVASKNASLTSHPSSITDDAGMMMKADGQRNPARALPICPCPCEVMIHLGFSREEGPDTSTNLLRGRT